MKKYFCEGCKKEVVDVNDDENDVDIYFSEEESISLSDVCDECQEKLHASLESAIERLSKKKPKPKRRGQ